MFRKTYDNLPEFPAPNPLLQLFDAVVSHSLPLQIILLGLIAFYMGFV